MDRARSHARTHAGGVPDQATHGPAERFLQPRLRSESRGNTGVSDGPTHALGAVDQARLPEGHARGQVVGRAPTAGGRGMHRLRALEEAYRRRMTEHAARPQLRESQALRRRLPRKRMTAHPQTLREQGSLLRKTGKSQALRRRLPCRRFVTPHQNLREQGSRLRKPGNPQPFVGACPAGDSLRPTKTFASKARSYENPGEPQSRRSLPCRRISGASPKPFASRARAYENPAKYQALRRSLPCRRIPGASPKPFASRARAYENPGNPNPVGVCPAGEFPGHPQKPSRARLAPTKTRGNPNPVGACPAGEFPGHPQNPSRAGLAPTKTGKSPALRRSLPCRRFVTPHQNLREQGSRLRKTGGGRLPYPAEQAIVEGDHQVRHAWSSGTQNRGNFMHIKYRSPIAGARAFGLSLLLASFIGAAPNLLADTAANEPDIAEPPLVSTGPGVDQNDLRGRFENRLLRSQSSREQLYWRLPATTRGVSQLDFLTDAGNWLLTQQQASGGFPFTPGETTTPPNVQAPIIAGLLRAWRRTLNPNFLDAAEQAGLYLRDNQQRFTSGNNSRRFTGADAFVFGEL